MVGEFSKILLGGFFVSFCGFLWSFITAERYFSSSVVNARIVAFFTAGSSCCSNTFKTTSIVALNGSISKVLLPRSNAKIQSSIIVSNAINMICSFLARQISACDPRKNEPMQKDGFKSASTSFGISIMVTSPPIPVIVDIPRYFEQIFVDFIDQYFHTKTCSTLVALGQGGFAWLI